MNDLAHIAVHNTLFALGLAACVYCIGRVWRKPPVVHLLWVLVLLKLVAPPVVEFEGPVFPMLEPTAMRNATIDERSLAQESQVESGRQIDDQPTTRTVLAGSTKPARVRSIDVDTQLLWTHLRPIVPALWVGGVALAGLLCVIRITRFEHRLRGMLPAPQRVRRAAQEVAGRLGVRRAPDIRLSETAEVPLVWYALGRPRIVLPLRLVQAFDDEQITMILAHEIAHLRRRDHWVRVVELFVSTLHWWNPLVWAIRRKLHDTEDLCCDSWVCWMFPKSAQRYAEVLLQVAESAGRPQIGSRWLPACGFLSSFSLKERIEMMLQNRFEPRVSQRSLLAIALATCLVIPMFFGRTKPAAFAAPNQETSSQAARTDASAKSDFPFTVKFEQGATAFHDGDKITIDEIRGTADTFAPGNIYLINGAYTLASHDKAMLAAYTTAMDAENAKGYSFKAQTIVVDQKQGKFTLFLPMSCRGWPHVSFYPADGGSDFGGAYFGTGESTLKQWWGTNEKDRKLSDAAARSNRVQMSVGEQAADYALIAAHWRMNDESQQFQALFKQLTKDFAPDSKVKTSFLSPDGKTNGNGAPNEFEKKLIADWSNSLQGSGNDSAERAALSGQPPVFYKAVRAKESCAGCHAPRSGELIGIAKVVLP